MNVLLITQARYGSTRLPGKVLKTVNDKTLLQIQLERLSRSHKVDKIVVATTDQPADEAIFNLVSRLGFFCTRGSENDVLDRFYQAAAPLSPEWVVRITSDCPLIDPALIDAVIDSTIISGADYGTNTFENCFPDGQDVEVFKFSALASAWENAKLPSEREHVTPYIRKNTDIGGGSLFKGFSFKTDGGYGSLRMTVDEPRDFQLATVLIQTLGTELPWKSYAKYIVDNELTSINADIIRNEGYLKSLKNDK